MTDSRKQKILHFLRQHRLALMIVVAVVLYIIGHYIHLEIAGKGTELLVEPTLEVIISRFIESDN